MKKLLIIHQGALGDFIMTFPVMIALRQVYSQIDALCQQKLGELARELNLIDKSYALESSAIAPLYGPHPDRVDTQTAARLQSYDGIILFSFSRRIQANIEQVAGCPILRIPPRPPTGEKNHVSRFLWGHLVRAGFIQGIEPPIHPSAFLQISPRPCRTPSDSAPVLIHPGSGSRKKNWPLKNFIRLERRLRKDKLRAEFILGPAEMDLREELAQPRTHGLIVHIVDDLLEILTLLKGACGFIGNDSGLSHLAAIIGLPVTVVFGPSDPDRWKPLGPVVAVVRPDLDCSPCHEDNETPCDSPKCFKEISPQMVYTAFCRLIQVAPVISPQ